MCKRNILGNHQQKTVKTCEWIAEAPIFGQFSCSPLETCEDLLPAWEPEMLGSQHHSCFWMFWTLFVLPLQYTSFENIWKDKKKTWNKKRASSEFWLVGSEKNWVPEYLAASICPHHWVVATVRCMIDHEWPTATGEWLDTTNIFMSSTNNLLSTSFKVSQHLINFDVVRILGPFSLIPFQDFTMVWRWVIHD